MTTGINIQTNKTQKIFLFHKKLDDQTQSIRLQYTPSPHTVYQQGIHSAGPYKGQTTSSTTINIP